MNFGLDRPRIETWLQSNQYVNYLVVHQCKGPYKHMHNVYLNVTNWPRDDIETLRTVLHKTNLEHNHA